MKISIIIPAYNEEKRIGRTLEEFSEFFLKIQKSKQIYFSILVVINNTRDRTKEIVKKLMKKYEQISFLDFKRGGKGFALTEGFKHSIKDKKNFDLIGFVDADLATSPNEYLKLIEHINENDGVIADRYAKESKVIPRFSFRRIIVSRILNLIVRVLFLLPYRDTQCGAKVFKKKILEKVISDLTITQWAYDIDLLYNLKENNAKIISIPTIWKEMEGSKLNIIRASIEMIFAILQLRIIRSRFKKIIKPLENPIGAIYKILKRN